MHPASSNPRVALTRRKVLAMALTLPVAGLGGCLQQSRPGSPALVWGRKGLDDGRFIKPRGIAINEADEIFIVDKTSRIQVFDREGQFIRSWRTPACVNGKPCGLSISHDGLLIVPDTHYFRVLFYTYEGEMVEARTIGGTNGRGPGEFGFLTDVVQDSKNNYYVTEYGDYDRIQKFDTEGSFLFQWGSHGIEPGEFLRPQGLFIDGDDQLWIADASNHRVQIYDLTKSTPTFVRQFGGDGSAPGQMRYPYTIDMDGEGFVHVCELGNHRIQKFTSAGESVSMLGGAGRAPGQFHQPWGFAFDSSGAMHVIDSYNHRVQRFDHS